VVGSGLIERIATAPPATIDAEQEGPWTEAIPRDPSAGA
jgi:hypothetical protein